MLRTFFKFINHTADKYDFTICLKKVNFAKDIDHTNDGLKVREPIFEKAYANALGHDASEMLIRADYHAVEGRMIVILSPEGRPFLVSIGGHAVNPHPTVPGKMPPRTLAPGRSWAQNWDNQGNRKQVKPPLSHKQRSTIAN